MFFRVHRLDDQFSSLKRVASTQVLSDQRADERAIDMKSKRARCVIHGVLAKRRFISALRVPIPGTGIPIHHLYSGMTVSGEDELSGTVRRRGSAVRLNPFD